MSVEIIECMVRDKISISDIEHFFLTHFKISSEKLLNSNEYWDKVLNDKVDYICIEVRHSKEGFLTLVKGYITANIDSAFYEDLALNLVKVFLCDVVVPDYREKFEGPDRIIIYFKNGKCAEGINIFSNGFNDIEITSYISPDVDDI